MDVPIAKSLSEIYPEDALESQTRRWNALISKFREDYGKLPDFVSRSPGRVNIIGEVGYIQTPRYRATRCCKV
jgi:galactokinase